MKKLSAILLLSVLLFNLAGYTLVFQYFINQADTQLVKQLDKTAYNDKDLVEVKVPLNMPYITDKEYERVDGQLEYNGFHYNYVKRKVTNDTLYVLCLPNVSKTQLYNAKAAYSKEVNDIPGSKKSTEIIKKISFVSEYNCTANQYNINPFVAVFTINPYNVPLRLPDNLLSVPEQPPKASC